MFSPSFLPCYPLSLSLFSLLLNRLLLFFWFLLAVVIACSIFWSHNKVISEQTWFPSSRELQNLTVIFLKLAEKANNNSQHLLHTPITRCCKSQNHFHWRTNRQSLTPMYTTRHHTKILTRKLIPNQTTKILHHTNQYTGWQTITKPDSSLPHQLHYLHHRQHTHPINHNPKKKIEPTSKLQIPTKN